MLDWYFDFLDPASLAVAERLQAAGVAVQFRPVRDSQARVLAARRLAEVRQRVPDLAVVQPPALPRTDQARSAIAWIRTHQPERAMAFVLAGLRALWQGGADLSDPALLATLAAEAGLDRVVAGPEEAAAAVRDQTGWLELGSPELPCLSRHDGRVLIGLAPADVYMRFAASPVE